jgi:hypothetical protein
MRASHLRSQMRARTVVFRHELVEQVARKGEGRAASIVRHKEARRLLHVVRRPPPLQVAGHDVRHARKHQPRVLRVVHAIRFVAAAELAVLRP